MPTSNKYIYISFFINMFNCSLPLLLHWGDVHVASGVSGSVGQILLQHHEGGDQTRHDHQTLLTGGDGRSSLQTGRNGKETIVECGFLVKLNV